MTTSTSNSGGRRVSGPQPAAPAGWSAIHLSRLALTGFRNHRKTELTLGPGLTVFQGANGHGKSNLLEAVYLLAIAKSPRAVTDRETINWEVGEAGGHVQVLGTARAGDEAVQVQVDLDVLPPGQGEGRSPGRELRVNGVERTAADFVGRLNVVYFDASDIEIVQGSPSARRRFLDILLSQTSQAYLKALQRYSRVVVQRNHLLRRLRERAAGEDELAFWDERLAYEGATIIEARSKALVRLGKVAVRSHAELTPGERLAITYRAAVDLDESPDGLAGMTHPEIAGVVTRSLAQARPRDIGQAATTVGPHRDDIEILLEGKTAAQFSSRGQARSIALAFKLAEAEYVREARGSAPVLALDDVLSELDPLRRRLVMEKASGFEQVLLTVTEFDLIEPRFLKGAARFHIERGEVTPVAA